MLDLYEIAMMFMSMFPAVALVERDATNSPSLVSMTDASGRNYTFKLPRMDTLAVALTSLGGFLTGTSGVGVGELLMPQLTGRFGVPTPVAAGSSVLVVFATVAAAAVTQVAELLSAKGEDAFPLNLICMTVPGVIIGGQLAPVLQGKIPQKQVSTRVFAYSSYL
jgi:uncharacterized membrane protein YfcA